MLMRTPASVRQFLAAMACVASPVMGQLPTTRLDAVFPPGLQAGSETTVALTGLDLAEVDRLIFSDAGLSAVHGEGLNFKITASAGMLTKGVPFSFDQLIAPGPPTAKLGAMLDDIAPDDPRWSRMQGLKDKQVRDLEAGKAGAVTQLIPTLTQAERFRIVRLARATWWYRAGVRSDAQQFLGLIERVYPGIAAHWNGKATQSIPHLSRHFGASYAYYRVGQYTRYAGVEAEIEGGVHFAGEHTSINFQGYMEGAAETGRRAALEVIRRTAS